MVLVTSGSVLVTGRCRRLSSRSSRSGRLSRSSSHTDRHSAVLSHQSTRRRALRNHSARRTLVSLNSLNVGVQQNILSGQSSNRLILGQTHQRGDLYLTGRQDNVHGATSLNGLSTLIIGRALLRGQLHNHTGRNGSALHSGDAAIHQTQVLQSVTDIRLTLTLQVIRQLDLLRTVRNSHNNGRALIDLRTNTRLNADNVALLDVVRVALTVLQHEAQVTQLVLGIIAGNIHHSRNRNLRNLIELVLVVQHRADTEEQQSRNQSTHKETNPRTLTRRRLIVLCVFLIVVQFLIVFILEEAVEAAILHRSLSNRGGVRGVILTQGSSSRRRNKSSSHRCILNHGLFTRANNRHQSLSELSRALITLIRVLRQTLQNHSIQTRRNLKRGELARRLRNVREVLSRQINIRLSIERRTTSNHLVNHASNRVQIATGVNILAADLLRGHVACATHHHISLGQRLASFLNGTGNTEIHDLNLARLTLSDILAGTLQHHNICRLNIAVNDAHRVAVLQSTQQLLGITQSITDRQMTATGQDGTQSMTLHVLHHDIRNSGALFRRSRIPTILRRVIRTGVIDSNNRRIVQRRHSLRLTLKACAERIVLGLLRAQNLKRNLAAEASILSSINGCHRTGTDYLEYLVTVINRVGNRQVHKFSWITKTKTKSKCRG